MGCLGTGLIGLVAMFVWPSMHLGQSNSGQECSESELALQVLGSGGPAPDDNRASSGYLIWHKGKAVVLIEAGGGVFTQFGAAGANLNDLELIALTHFHTDHSADLPALMKGTYFFPTTSSLNR